MGKFILGMVLTIIGIGTIGYVVLGDNIKIERVEQSHNRTIIEDGTVASSQDWTEVLGFNISIDLVDGTYIGK